jgi:glutamate/tyrosine decarboxylase-like PLP-dependent enzyme
MGKQYLAKKYNKNPINLISDGAHYSHGKSALLTGLQTRIIPTD